MNSCYTANKDGHRLIFQWSTVPNGDLDVTIMLKQGDECFTLEDFNPDIHCFRQKFVGIRRFGRVHFDNKSTPTTVKLTTLNTQSEFTPTQIVLLWRRVRIAAST